MTDVDSVASLLNVLRDTQDEWQKSTLWFRGQDKHKWLLKPSFFRRWKHVKNREDFFLAKFRQQASSFLDNPPSGEQSAEWLPLMCHYGIPTRLLDWSESPLTALYFAVLKSPGSDAAFWILRPNRLNKENLNDVRYRGRSLTIYHEVIEKKYSPYALLSEGEQNTELKPLAIIVPRTNSRILAQKGTFTISRNNVEIEEDVEFLKKFRIPSAAKIIIKKELEFLGVAKSGLFPGLDSLGEEISRAI